MPSQADASDGTRHRRFLSGGVARPVKSDASSRGIKGRIERGERFYGVRTGRNSRRMDDAPRDVRHQSSVRHHLGLHEGNRGYICLVLPHIAAKMSVGHGVIASSRQLHPIASIYPRKLDDNL